MTGYNSYNLNSNFNESIQVIDSSGNIYGTLIIGTCGKVAQVTFLANSTTTTERVTSVNKVTKLPKEQVFIILFTNNSGIEGNIKISKDGTISIVKLGMWVYGSNAYVIND